MGNTCKPMAVSFQCMTKSTTNKKKKKRSFDHTHTHTQKRSPLFQYHITVSSLYPWAASGAEKSSGTHSLYEHIRGVSRVPPFA